MPGIVLVNFRRLDLNLLVTLVFCPGLSIPKCSRFARRWLTTQAIPLLADIWADRLAISTKTFYRRFQRGTGVTFGKWRQQMRLMSSLAMLLEGMPITRVALCSGYESH